MSSTRKAWMVAVSVGVVEALKDQAGMCRWNYTLRSIHQYTKNRVKSSVSQVTSSSSIPASSVIPDQIMMMKQHRDHEMKQSDESLRTVMYLSCWGPN
ncbi:hypothetical protein C5167_025995 [Papaver somniferum]|uniref:Wound-responsive family protein n=1 Tax=Papaver somniferum TaxID=3469 RepID=A0A4Y7JT03_PAPSO|nr:uncharacterized protein LOC113278620 [Papaver somniferum]RZC64233.1 hypothetical protein C5167_025995 [Papaver somniferum]